MWGGKHSVTTVVIGLIKSYIDRGTGNGRLLRAAGTAVEKAVVSTGETARRGWCCRSGQGEKGSKG